MWRVFQEFRGSYCAVAASLFFNFAAISSGNELQQFENCHFLPREWADGDSFMVALPDKREVVLRLYYVDSIEKSVSTTSDKRRLREQARYFGIEDYRTVADFGQRAADFTADILSEPFTVYTAFADARGRSGKPRYYAFVTTSTGRDLGRILVENGFARAFGMGRETPSGTHRDEWSAYLADVELVSAIQKSGAWKHSNPEAIIRMRAAQREEMRGLEAIDDAFTIQPPSEPVDLNTASLEDLMRTGLRESLADAVIQKRPFESVEQLLEVRGIGPVTFEKVKPYVRVSSKE